MVRRSVFEVAPDESFMISTNENFSGDGTDDFCSALNQFWKVEIARDLFRQNCDWLRPLCRHSLTNA